MNFTTKVKLNPRKHMHSRTTKQKFHNILSLFCWATAIALENAQANSPREIVCAIWASSHITNKQKTSIWKINARRERLKNNWRLLDRYALFTCNTKGNRSMKPADVKAIITLASKGNGMNNVLRQQDKPIAIVAKQFKWVEAWKPPPNVWFR